MLTPGGFRHRSLVHRVSRNEALHFTEARIQLIDLAKNARKDIPRDGRGQAKYPTSAAAGSHTGTGTMMTFTGQTGAGFDIEADRYGQNNRRKALANGDNEGTKVTCAHCGGVHTWTKGMLFLAARYQRADNQGLWGSIGKSRQRMT